MTGTSTPARVRLVAAAVATLSTLAHATACSSPPGLAGEDPVDDPRTTPGVLAFVDVRVVPMDREIVLPGQTVVVRDGRIEAVGPVGEVAVPDDAEVVAGGGWWLMPGLVDAHVHMGREDAPLYVRNGVTTVRNMWGWPGLEDIMADIEEGSLVGPTIHSYSSGLDQPPRYWPHTQIVSTPDRAREVVAEQADAGWIGIKVYRDLTPPVFAAIVEEAGRRNLPVVGHVPEPVGIDAALDAGQRSLAHLLGYSQALTGTYAAWPGSFDEEGMRELAVRTREAGAWNGPTLEILRRGGRPGHTNRMQAVRVLHEEGAELLVGTDAGIDVTLPGISIHAEMKLFQEAGIEPFQVLRDATYDVARFLGMEGEFGVVAPGARGDLLLLGANPLETVEHVSNIAGVMLRGRWMPR